MNTYTICSSDGEFIADRVTREQINRLCGYTEDGRALRKTENGDLVFGPRLIRAHKKRNYLYLSLVEPAVIRAELRREFSADFRGAEDCFTVSREVFSNDFGSGWLYTHNRRAGSYARNADALRNPEHSIRIAFKKRVNYAVIPVHRLPVRAPIAAKLAA